MNNDSVYFYHPMVWKHFKDIANSNSALASSTVEKITEFVPTSKTDDILFWAIRLQGRGVSGVDRAGKLNKFNVAYSPIPTVDASFNKTFGQICLETAENFWKNNSRIKVLWSGGIDSTSAALALLETKPENSVLSILCTAASIAEYPAFYNTHKDLCQVLTGEQFLSVDNLLSTELVVTGDVGDQLFGANLGSELRGEYFAKKDAAWTSIFEFPDPFKMAEFEVPQNPSMVVPWTSSQIDGFVDILNEHATACPFHVKTLFDMNWWLNFSMKMNYTTTRIPVLIMEQCKQDITLINLNNRQPFYLNDDFQRWSMTNHNIKVSTSLNTYKQPAKDFIFSLNGDADYAANKQKEASTPKMLANGWFGKWKTDTNANYAILGNGQVFNNKHHISTEILDSLFSDSFQTQSL